MHALQLSYLRMVKCFCDPEMLSRLYSIASEKMLDLMHSMFNQQRSGRGKPTTDSEIRLLITRSVYTEAPRLIQQYVEKYGGSKRKKEQL